MSGGREGVSACGGISNSREESSRFRKIFDGRKRVSSSGGLSDGRERMPTGEEFFDST